MFSKITAITWHSLATAPSYHNCQNSWQCKIFINRWWIESVLYPGKDIQRIKTLSRYLKSYWDNTVTGQLFLHPFGCVKKNMGGAYYSRPGHSLGWIQYLSHWHTYLSHWYSYIPGLMFFITWKTIPGINSATISIGMDARKQLPTASRELYFNRCLTNERLNVQLCGPHCSLC